MLDHTAGLAKAVGASVIVFHPGFLLGREVVVTGTLRNGVFVAQDGSLTTKCPSKYAPAKSKT
jgi:hypothetical protein